ncbi:MAG: hypothetical protein V4706_08185 [Pseudomonadota bacterium]
MRLTANHVREFVGVGRTEFQRWLTLLPPYAAHKTQARKARVFDARDLVFFATVRILVNEVGLRLSAIAGFSECMRNDLAKLSDLSIESRCVTLNYANSKGWSIGVDGVHDTQFNLTMDVAETWLQVHQFLGLTSDWTQSNLQLGLTPVGNSNKRRLIA